MLKMLNATSSFVPTKYPIESDVVNTKQTSIEERLKYHIGQGTYKSLNDPQFPRHLQLKPEEDRRVLRNNYENFGAIK